MDRAFQVAALGVFLALFLGRSLYLALRHGVQPFALARGKPFAHALLEGSLVVVLPAFLVQILAGAWPIPALLPPPRLDPVLLDAAWARWVGAGLVSAALLLFAAALASFGTSWRVGIDAARPGRLVTGGVFAFSRNPIFLSMDLYVLGSFLLAGRASFLAFAVLAALGLHWQIRQEERFLDRLHGEPYRAWMRRTPRYLGLPRT